MLTIQNIERQSGGVYLFSEFGITLLPGSLLRIEGANGSGKTWLLEMIAGKVPVETDCILFAQEETRGDSEFFNEVIYLPQRSDASLKPKLTVRKQVERLAHKGSNELIDAALNYFGLNALANEKVAALTYGQQQRVYLTPLITQPSLIWLLDRPMMGLDMTARKAVDTLIAGRCQQNGIVIYTHEGDSLLNPHGLIQMDEYLTA
ncbi:MAG: ATP-binding cassette domain-containing protein [Rickettsiales bacterium]|nr:ATP-binding cassette domain-containing protein [Rickettsiales bacterium]